MFGTVWGPSTHHVKSVAGDNSTAGASTLVEADTASMTNLSIAVGGSSQADHLKRNYAMDDSIGGS